MFFAFGPSFVRTLVIVNFSNHRPTPVFRCISCPVTVEHAVTPFVLCSDTICAVLRLSQFVILSVANHTCFSPRRVLKPPFLGFLEVC